MKPPQSRATSPLSFSLALIAVALAGVPARAGAYDSDRASFTIRVDGDECPYQVLGIYVRPGERIPIEVSAPTSPASTYTLLADAGEVIDLGPGRWQWRAPEQVGSCRLAVLRDQSDEATSLNAFIVVPFEQASAGVINGYKIGIYPALVVGDSPFSLALSPRYSAPIGFVEVTEDNRNTLVSPHFRLGQFLCKETGDFPKYMVLQSRLPLKLERILEEVNRLGYHVESFAIMSGYRTPFYNASIGNVSLSRHQWGDAADVYVDEHPADGVMDDLNHDGRINIKDSKLLYDIIDRLQSEPLFAPLVGGLGLYETNSEHGPFVHVDVRGRAAHW